MKRLKEELPKEEYKKLKGVEWASDNKKKGWLNSNRT